MSALSVGVLILGGGEATRLPGKLALAADGLPLIARVYRNVAARREVYISAKATFESALDALLPAPVVVDRWAQRGPLGGMLSALAAMRSAVVFAVAGDAPFVTSAFIDRLAAAWTAGDEALVPTRTLAGEAHLEPLAALYDRLAFLREGFPVLRAGRGALHLAIGRLRARFVPVEDERIFANVNTPQDYAALRTLLRAEPD